LTCGSAGGRVSRDACGHDARVEFHIDGSSSPDYPFAQLVAGGAALYQKLQQVIDAHDQGSSQCSSAR